MKNIQPIGRYKDGTNMASLSSKFRPSLTARKLLTVDSVDPVFHDTSWSDYAAELLNSEVNHSALDLSLDGHNVDSAHFFSSQEHTEDWAPDSATPPVMSSSTSPVAEPNEEKICYGMVCSNGNCNALPTDIFQIYRASVRLKGDMSELHAKLSNGGDYPVPGHYQLGVTKCEQQFTVIFPDGSCLGEVNAQLERALTGIVEQEQHVDLEVFAPIRPIQDTIGRAYKKGEAIVRVNVNLYGTRAAAHSIGQELSNHKIYLQQPDYCPPKLTYDNPHVLKLKNFQVSTIDQTVGAPEEEQPEDEFQKAEAFKMTISTIYSSLTRNQSLVGLEGDDRLKTKLLPHQKQALDFMEERESGPIRDKYRLWKPCEVDGKPCYRHLVTNNVSHLEHTETGGGILADEMGMGKTLSILALILRTLGAAHSWAQDNPTLASSELKTGRRSRAALIVASSDLMINEWFQEMDRHFHRHVCDVLTMIKYHGTNRQIDSAKLRDADIVLTTYHTLASDHTKNKDLLRDIEWYRLVLDEAHIIRRQSTVLYRTVAELKARSRWCLTGTPIQNRLEDIGSLFAFIRIVPFNSSSIFRKYIAIPFDDGGQRRDMAIKRFTRLLDSMCLRRTKDLLHLPDQEDRVRRIDFSTEERTQYEHTKNMMMRAAKNQVGGLDQNSTLGLFQVRLQLRILCNHGTYQQPFSWNRRKLHLIDEREAMEASLGRDGEVTCSVCKQTMSLLDAGTMFRRFTEHCRHVLCHECIEESMSHIADNSTSSCPLCSHLWVNSKATHTSEEDQYFRLHGKSSKMEALMMDVQTDVWSSKRCANTSCTS
jgi:SWI/SNF-related matrix-associated actin-dependent regulator of chromatin subfamily A3